MFITHHFSITLGNKANESKNSNDEEIMRFLQLDMKLTPGAKNIDTQVPKMNNPIQNKGANIFSQFHDLSRNFLGFSLDRPDRKTSLLRDFESIEESALDELI